jgi:hypothetical protein
MSITGRLQVAGHQDSFRIKRFMTTAKAIQLDACFAFLISSPHLPGQLPTFCELLFNSVAGSDADGVREQLADYAEIRKREKGEEALFDVLLAEADRLQHASDGNSTDPRDSARCVAALMELIRQGAISAEDFATPLPHVDKWQERCEAIARFLEHGRMVEAENLRSVLGSQWIKL